MLTDAHGVAAFENASRQPPTKRITPPVSSTTAHRFSVISDRQPAEHLSVAASTRHDEGDNQSVQAQRLGEDKDEDHSDEKLRLLSGGTHTGVTNNANSSSGGETGQTDSHTAAKVSETDLRAVAFLARRDCAHAGPG